MERVERVIARPRVGAEQKVHRATKRGAEVRKEVVSLETRTKSTRTPTKSVCPLSMTWRGDELMRWTEGKIATAEDAARVDKDPPLDQLMRLLKDDAPKTEKGDSVVYWMRMEDMRSKS